MRTVAGVALDALDRARGRRDALTPPRRFVSGDYSDFERIGEEFRNYFVDLGELRRSDAVLDVGCGVGRMAVPLTRYLDPSARYEGFDVVPREVDWCRRHITARHPNFRFSLIDVRNPRYNPDGIVDPTTVVFPYADESFDFAILTSVFTHMRAEESAHYLDELARVLRPGGRFLITYFLLNRESRERIDARGSHFEFAHGHGPARWEDADDPEAAVAYDQQAVRERHAARGLPITIVRPGYWSGRPDFLTWQDVVVGHRTP
jgi:SAM-dependent methyltransferase